jgi:hypothetical protein
MVRAAIKEATELQRKQFVPDHERTPDRDELADWIEREIVDGAREWADMTISEIHEETGWSREHVARVLDGYFEAASGDRDELDRLLQSMPSPSGGDEYQQGYRAGWNDCLRWSLQNREKLAELLE